MRTTVKGKNIAVPTTVRTYATRKLHRLERFLDDRTDALVELSLEQHRSAQDSHIAEVTLVIDGQTLRGRAFGPTFQAATDAVIDRIERRAVDYRKKPRSGGRSSQDLTIRRRPAEETAEGREEPRVVKTKRFAIEPMFEDDAIERMNALGHTFFVFVNAETEHLAVLYRRTDGNYGLIEPIVGGTYTPGREGGRAPV